MMRTGIFLTLCLPMLLLGSCARQEPAALLEDYLWRLENVTGLQVAVSQAAAPAPVPPPRERRFELGATGIGMLDFLALHDCGLGVLLGQRNSSLGRVMDDSSRLQYELEFLHRSSRCLQGPDGLPQGELRSLLAEAVRRKEKEFRLVLWNAVFANRHSTLFSPAAAPIGPDRLIALQAAAQQSANLRAAAFQLQRGGFTGASKLRREDLVAAVDELARSNGGGALVKTVVLLTDTLERAAQLLQRSRAQKPPCADGRAGIRAHHLDNVLRRVYIARVQPFVAAVRRHGGALLGDLHQLDRDAGAAPSEAWLHFRRRVLEPQTSDGMWQQFESAIATHNGAWQQLLGDCGMMPAAPAP